MNINLDQAHSFCVLVETGSYQEAARVINKSHSAVVYSILCFEQQCGVKLLNRDSYRTTLTAEGRRIYQECRQVLHSAGQLEKLCAKLSKGWEPSVRLIYDGVLNPEPFLQTFKYFKEKKIPSVLSIYSEYLHGVEKSFVEFEGHFMITVLPSKLADLEFVKLKPVKNILVAHKKHPLFHSKKKWDLLELKAFNFFTVRGADKSLNLGTDELEEASIFHLSDFSLKKWTIMKGIGFGWLPQHMIEKELKSGTLKPVHWSGESIQELYPRLYFKKKLGPASQILLSELIK